MAPVNNGAGVADYEILMPDVLGWFFPDLLGTEEALKHMKITSPTLAQLNYDEPEFDIEKWGTQQHLAQGVRYRNIMGINYSNGNPAINPLFFPKTMGNTLAVKKSVKGRLYSYWTRQGDGVVAMQQSILIGSNVGNESIEGLNHNTIHDSQDVITKVVEYIKNPASSLSDSFPVDDPDDLSETIYVLKNLIGTIASAESKQLEFPVNLSMNRLIISVIWSGSELGLTLVSPEGQIMDLNSYPVIEYWKEDNSIWCMIDSPNQGLWKANINAIDVPEAGEPYKCMVFYTRPVNIQASISIEPKTLNLTSMGKWITCYIEIPAGYDVNEIDIGTVLLGGALKIQQSEIQNGILMAKFDREKTANIFGDTTGEKTLALSGFLKDGTYFEGIDTIILKQDKQVDTKAPSLPLHSALLQNYSNPFNPETWIPYQLAEDTNVIIKVYNISGQIVKKLDMGFRPAGFYIFRDKAAYWDGKNESGEYVSSGTYFYTIQAGEFADIKKMTIAK